MSQVDFVPLLVIDSEKKGLPLWAALFFYSIPER